MERLSNISIESETDIRAPFARLNKLGLAILPDDLLYGLMRFSTICRRRCVSGSSALLIGLSIAVGKQG
jgi:hypothetical protein